MRPTLGGELTNKADTGVGEEGDMRGTFPAGDFVTTGQPSDFTSNTMEAPELTGDNSGTVLLPSSNLAAQPDSYSMFQHLMEAQVPCCQAYELTGHIRRCL